MSSTEKCKIPHDSFCFVCGSYFFSVKTPTKTQSLLNFNAEIPRSLQRQFWSWYIGMR